MSLRLLHHNKEPGMSIKISEIVAAIEVLSRLEKSSFAQFSDPRFVGKLQGEAFLALYPLKRGIENLNLEVEVTND
jgi:hypothetical protein